MQRFLYLPINIPELILSNFVMLSSFQWVSTLWTVEFQQVIIECFKWWRNQWRKAPPNELRSKPQYLLTAYRDLSNNKGFQTKEWLPQEIMSKKYPTESLNEKWKRNLGDSDKLAFSNLFSKDILIFIILGFSGRKRTTLCQLLIKKKRNGQDKMRIWEVLKVLWFQPETVGRFRKMLLCT